MGARRDLPQAPEAEGAQWPEVMALPSYCFLSGAVRRIRASLLSGGGLVQEVHQMFFQSEKGQGLAEYALILALIAIAAVLALGFLSGTIQSILSTIGTKL